jgi:type 1 glutamine amidotransferase
VISRHAVFFVTAAIILCGGAGHGSQAPAPPGGNTSTGGVVSAIFTLLDANKDATLEREEVRNGFDAWFAQWDGKKTDALGFGQLYAGLRTMLPAGAIAGRQLQSRAPRAEDVAAMIGALPERAPAKPRQPRRVLVFAYAAGFVHTSIPLAARTIEEMGRKSGAWTTSVTYDPADINDANLKQYDAIFLASTTGEFLDEPGDPAATAARRQALLAFVRGGKGLAGIHAASDGYHRNSAPAGGGAMAGINWTLVSLAAQLMSGDANGDGQLSRAEFVSYGRSWFDSLDSAKTGRIAEADFPTRYVSQPPPALPGGGARGNRQGPATDRAPDKEVGTWPEFNRMLGAIFKFHWDDGQTITVKIEEPAHSLNAPFKGQGYVIVDETYTFSRDTYARANLRVLTSIDYAKMSPEDKAKEQHPRPDGDYALSWIRREGKGRVFYEAHGHNEKVYANRLLLEHILAGMQYVLGDLPADDAPSVPAANR